MHIAILAPHLKNAGGNRILFSYANGLIEKGHAVTVYTRSSNMVRRTIANAFQIGKPAWMPLRARVVRVPVWERRYIRNYDHIIAGGYQEANALASCGGACGEGWYMVQHDEGLYHGPRDEVDRALKSSLRKIVVSSWLQDVVRTRAEQESGLLLNAYDRAQFFPTEKTAHDSVRVLLLDHSYSWKGTEEGIALVRALQKKYPQIVLVGMGRRRAEAEALYDEYHFDPPQKDIHKIYAEADVFLCTSWDEGFGLPSLEAMACGTAVVTCDNGGSRDFARDEDTAFVAPHRDLETLAVKLEEAVRDVAKRSAIAQRGLMYVTQMPTWDAQVTNLETLLQETDQASHKADSPKKKILFAINCMNIGGAPWVVLSQMRYLDRERYEPHLLMLYKSKEGNFLKEVSAIPGVAVTQFHLRKRSVFDVRTLYQIYVFLRKERFDIVYTHLFLANLLVRLIAIAARVPHIISFEHSVYFNKSRWQVYADRFLARFTDRVLFSTENVAQFTLSQQRLKKTQCAVVRNLVTIPTRAEVDVVALRERVGAHALSKIFVTVGRFSPEKGHAVLIDAAASVHDAHPHALFVLVGHGASESALRERVRAYAAEPYIHIVHDPEHAKEFLHIADCFILPSLREGQGMAAEEALMAGVPVVASRLEGMDDLIKDKVNGLLVEKEKPEELARAIISVLTDASLYAEIKAGAANTHATMGTPEDRARQFEAVLDSLF